MKELMGQVADLHPRPPVPSKPRRYPIGGIDGYVEMGGGRGHNDFFTNPRVKKIFQDHIKFLMNRRNTINGRIYKARTTATPHTRRARAAVAAAVLLHYAASRSAAHPLSFTIISPPPPTITFPPPLERFLSPPSPIKYPRRRTTPQSWVGTSPMRLAAPTAHRS